MNYRLVILTHGEGETLHQTMATFDEFVSPAPADCVLVRDEGKEGFCKATGRAWAAAADSDVDYVFWLEHDFSFLQPVDLEPMAALLDADVNLAQIALMRGPVNEMEITAGGIVASRPDQFRLKHAGLSPYLEHTSFFTTNPSLMRRRFMALYPWPEYERECEGLFGIDLLQKGFHFAFWGEGEPWVEHTGARTGFGY